MLRLCIAIRGLCAWQCAVFAHGNGNKTDEIRIDFVYALASQDMFYCKLLEET